MAGKRNAKKKASKKAAKKSKTPRAKRTPSQAGKAARAKGARGELKITKALKTLWPDRTNRSGQVSEQVWKNHQDRGGNRDGPDIETPHFDIEVKHRASTCMPHAIRDAIANCRPSKAWAAVDYPTTGPRKTPVIAMDFYAFVAFVAKEREEIEAVALDEGYDVGIERSIALLEEHREMLLKAGSPIQQEIAKVLHTISQKLSKG